MMTFASTAALRGLKEARYFADKSKTLVCHDTDSCHAIRLTNLALPSKPLFSNALVSDAAAASFGRGLCFLIRPR